MGTCHCMKGYCGIACADHVIDGKCLSDDQEVEESTEEEETTDESEDLDIIVSAWTAEQKCALNQQLWWALHVMIRLTDNLSLPNLISNEKEP